MPLLNLGIKYLCFVFVHGSKPIVYYTDGLHGIQIVCSIKEIKIGSKVKMSFENV